MQSTGLPLEHSPVCRPTVRNSSASLDFSLSLLTPTIFPTKSLIESLTMNGAKEQSKSPTVSKIRPLIFGHLADNNDQLILKKRAMRKRLDSLSEADAFEKDLSELIAPEIWRNGQSTRMVPARPKYAVQQCGEDPSLLECCEQPQLEIPQFNLDFILRQNKSCAAT